MLKVVLKAYVDRPGDVGDADPHPDTITLTTRDPNLEGLLTMFQQFTLGMGFTPPSGHLDYMEEDE